jgi:NAD-dependent deacetylase
MYTGHEDYQFHTVESSAEKDARLVVFIGTSFSVGVTALVLDGARMRGVPVFNIDPTPRVDEDEIRHVTMPSEVVLVEVCRALGVTVPELAPAPLT